MITQFVLFIALIIGAASPLHASQRAAKSTSQQQDQKPSQAELKEFFDSAYDNHAKAFELIQKYGKNIINQHMGFLKSPILIIAVDSSWSRAEFECLLGVPEIDINISDGICTPLTMAMFEAVGGDPEPDQLKKIEMLIKHGANLNTQSSFGFTPLMLAARDNQPQVIALLLQAGASTDGVITDGFYKGKTFFALAKEKPAVWKAYNEYRIEQAPKKAQAAKIALQEITNKEIPCIGIIKEYLMPTQEESDFPASAQGFGGQAPQERSLSRGIEGTNREKDKKIEEQTL